MSPLTISISETAKVLGLGRTKVYEILASGAIESIKIGRRRLVKFESVQALLEKGQ